MSLTIAAVADSLSYWGQYVVQTFDITLDSSYPTNGYAVTAASFGIGRTLVGMQFLGGNKAAGEIIPWFDTANKKIVCYFPSGGASAATSLAAPAAAAPGVGTFAVTTTPDAGGTTLTGSAAKPALVGVISGALAAPAITGGIGIEVGNTANLSTLTVRALVVTLG